MRQLRRLTVVLLALIALLLALLPNLSAAQDADATVVAESAIVIDATTGEVLFERNSTTPRAMASLTKLFTALVALETTPLDATMTVEPSDLVGEASMGLVAGDTVRFETLLHGLLLPSGNDAASTIARVAGGGSVDAFVQRANQRIAQLGLTHTHLVNPHGLDADGHYSTARDIAALTMYALEAQPTIARVISNPAYAGDGYSIYNTNRLLDVYPGLIGGKTGVTDAAGYCLMQVAEVDGRRVVVVLLGSTFESWYADAEALLNIGFAALDNPVRLAAAPPVVITAAEPVVEAASAPVASNPQVSVVRAEDGATVVGSPALSASRSFSPWFWFVTIGATIPALAFVAHQSHRLLSLAASGPRPTSFSRPAGARRPAAAPAETQPFTLATSVPAPGPINRWTAPSPRRDRRAAGERVPATPYFAGD